MSGSVEFEDKEPNFQWGQKTGDGSENDVHFYHSFIYDDMEYSLYDCVYLFKNDEIEPYIGKIVRIWMEPDGNKKVKILWFFRPSEIKSYLGNDEVSENEIFLASGEGVGLSNVNPLEAIAGKCFVVCTSKDMRNVQPSREELEMADYIFCRTFDVGSYTISKKMADAIAGIKVKYLLNQPDHLELNSESNDEANVTEAELKTNETAVLIDIFKPGSLELIENQVKNAKFEQVTCPISRSGDTERKHPSEGKHPCDDKLDSESKHHWINVGEFKHTEENSKSFKKRAVTNLYDDRSSKKMRLSEGSVRLPNDLQRMNVTTKRRQILDSDDDDIGKDYAWLHKESSNETVRLGKEKMSLAVSVKNDSKIYDKIVEVTRRPDADRSKWFSFPWEKITSSSAFQGRLVFLENLDPSFTSSEIEDLIYSVFKQPCSARVIQQGTFHSPNDGQAYVLFQTQAAADQAVQIISEGCLMLPGGRPLLAGSGMLKLPTKSNTYIGHLCIDKLKLKQHREWKKAVATSHCSQPNTVEYVMAMEWMLIQERSACSLNRLNEQFASIGDRGKSQLKLKF